MTSLDSLSFVGYNVGEWRYLLLCKHNRKY